MSSPLYVVRVELYKQVWSEPMTALSKRYQISDVALAKICRKMKIPIPGRGYWARLASGQKITIPALPATSSDTPQRVEINPPQPRQWKKSVEPIPVQATLTSPHPLTLSLQANLAKKHPDGYGRLSSDGNEISVRVGPASVPRLMKIVDAFVKAAEERGFTFRHEKDHKGEYLAIVMGGRPVQFLFMERSRRSSDLPPASRFGSQYAAVDYVPTGKLSFQILEYVFDQMEPTWSDSVRNPLESRLGEIFLALGKAAEELRERDERIRREKEERQEAEAARREAEFQHKKLIDDLGAWSAAETLRRMINQVEKRLLEGAVQNPAYSQRWLEWARAKVVDLDPLSAGLDAFFEQYQPDPDRLPPAYDVRREHNWSPGAYSYNKLNKFRRLRR